MDRDEGGFGLPDVRVYNRSFQTTKLANHWDRVDLDWTGF